MIGEYFASAGPRENRRGTMSMAQDEKKGLFRKKEEEPPRWDDGEEESQPDKASAGMRFSMLVMSLYGGIAGMLGSQFAKYLHQVFACNAFGIQLTSRRVPWYGPAQLVADTIIFFFLYGAILGLGVLISLGLREGFLRETSDNLKEDHQRIMARGFFWLIVVSVVIFFLPINVFLLGVPAR